MNLKTFNESFHKYYTEDFDNQPKLETTSQELRKALESTVNYLNEVGQTNPFLQAMSLTRTIENVIPDKSWWEVTKCNIEGELGNGLPLDKITDCIIDNIQPEYNDITESVDDNDDWYVGDEYAGRIYHGKSSALKAFNNLKSNGIDAVMNKVEDGSLDELKEKYEEPELLGKGYAAPVSRDFVREISNKLKRKEFEDFEIVQRNMSGIIDDIEDFDKYWKEHKSAVMKNIKEAQDLIPVEYRI